VTNYTVNDGNSGGNYKTILGTAKGSITQADLNINAVTGSRTYTGDTKSAGVATVTGLISGSGDTVTNVSQSYDNKNVQGTDKSTLAVTNYTVNDGNSGGNYKTILGTAKGSITARVLTALLTGEIKKIYDGNNAATLAAANYQLGNVVAGESIGVNKTTGTYNSANVLDTKTASANLEAVDFTAASGTALSNYVLPTSATGDASIKARVLTAILTGEIRKIYDGNDTATLAAANYQLGNVVAGESIGVSKTTGTFNSANVLDAKTASATLAPGDFVAGSGTTLSNYSLPLSAGGGASITAKALTIDAIANNKVYDGNAIATLTGAGGGAVKIDGLVAGQTLGLSGQFDNPNVGSGKPVTVAGISTDSALASNYIVMQLAQLKADITAVFVAALADTVVVPAILPSLASIMNITPDVLHLSPQVKVTGGADVSNFADVSGASEVQIDNVAELSLDVESVSLSEKITSTTMLGLNVALEIVGGGLQLNNPSVNNESNK
jgi:hypothetical protein